MIDLTLADGMQRSLYRPFGHLPMPSDIPDTAKTTLFGFSCVCIGLSFVAFFAVLTFLCRHFQTITYPFNQRYTIILILGGIITTTTGFISLADAVTQYPDSQSPFGYVFESMSIVGFICAFMPGLFFRPLVAKMDIETEPLKTKVTAGVSLLFTLILTSFTIATLCLDGTKYFPLLLTHSLVRVMGVAMISVVGVWIIVAVERTQYDNFSYEQQREATTTLRGGSKLHPKFQFLLRMIYLISGMGVSMLYIITLAFESPFSIWVRAGQAFFLFAALLVISLFAWSLIISIRDMAKNEAQPFDKPHVINVIDKILHITIENGFDGGIMRPVKKRNLAQPEDPTPT